MVSRPAGYESSRFLASVSRANSLTLKVDGCCSVRELVEQLHSRGIDLVIATVPSSWRIRRLRSIPRCLSRIAPFCGMRCSG
ncbi:MAG: hypothetical protein ACLRVN_06180 [Butyricicoccus sp.]